MCWVVETVDWRWCVCGLCDWQVVEDGYEFFAKRQLVTLFSAPNYCGEFDNAGAMMSVDETLMCSFQVVSINFCIQYYCCLIKSYLAEWVLVSTSLN